MFSLTPVQRWRAVLVAVLLIIVGWLLYSASSSLFPFIVGIFLIYLLMPIVDYLDERMPKWLREHRISRPLSILLVYALLILIVVGFVTLFVPVMSQQVRELVEVSGQYTVKLLGWTKGINQPALDELLERFYVVAPDWVQDAVESNIQQLSAFLTNALQNIISWIADALQRAFMGTWSVVSSTVTFVIGIVIVPFWVFYMLNDKVKVSQGIYSVVPEKYRQDVHNLQAITSEVLGSYVRGQLLLCLAVGGAATVGLMVLGVNFSLLLGTVAGILEVIPGFGPYLGGIPAVLVALLKSPALAFKVIILFFVIQQIENTFLVPKVVGASVQIHPTVVMVILVVGSAVAGIWGMVLGVPITAIFRDLFYYLYLRLSDVEVKPDEAIAIVHPVKEIGTDNWSWLTWRNRLIEAYHWVAAALVKAWAWMRAKWQEWFVQASTNDTQDPKPTKSDVGR